MLGANVLRLRGELRVLGSVAVLLAYGVDVAASITDEIRALAPFAAYVGTWRGEAGADLRAKQKPCSVEWAWAFDGGHASIVGQLSGGKSHYYTTLALQSGPKPTEFVLIATIDQGPTVDGLLTPHRFSGTMAGGVLVLVADQEQEESYPDRVSLRNTDDRDRLIILFERRSPGGGYARLVELDLKRQGVPYAQAVAKGHTCVVTGGPALHEVTYQGKTYYACCSGCRDYFLENAANVLAERQDRK